MYKLKRVFICDICENVALPREVPDNMDGVVKVPPAGWRSNGKVHICSRCRGASKEDVREVQDGT